SIIVTSWDDIVIENIRFVFDKAELTFRKEGKYRTSEFSWNTGEKSGSMSDGMNTLADYSYGIAGMAKHNRYRFGIEVTNLTMAELLREPTITYVANSKSKEPREIRFSD
ncbi:hypothetical protein PMAYCL1PPCAC_13587, partial [Pristionchus mayeri]